MADGEPRESATRWILGATALVTALLVREGALGGDWRAVAVTEVQVLAVAAACWIGLR